MSYKRPAFLDELLKTVKLALPIAMGLAGQGALFVADGAMARRIGETREAGDTALAAAALGGSFSLLPFVFGLGLAVAVPVLTAQAQGARRPREGSAALRHGLLITAVFGLAVGIAAQLGADVLDLLNQDAAVIAEAKPFAILMCWSVLPALLFQCLKNHREAIGHPWVSLLWLCVGISVNLFCNWVFMYGNLGAPAMGLAGGGLGTLIARCVMLAGLALHPGAQPVLWREGIQRARLAESLKIGVPSSFQWVFEAGVFALAPVLVGEFGREQQAAYQIAYSLASFAYMIPLGLAQGASIRAGEAFGAKNIPAIRRIAAGTLLFATLFMGLYTAGVVALRDWIPAAFRPDADGVDAGMTAVFAAKFLVAAGAFALFDGIQVVTGGVLRGMSDVTFSSVAAFVCYWLVCLPIACLLGFVLDMQGLGIWLGLGVGVLAAACALGLRLIRKLKMN